MAGSKVTARQAVIVGVCAIAIALLAWVRFSATSVEEGDGTIWEIDYAGREATIEVVNPSTGKTLVYQGVIPSECVITINNKQAAFADLLKGDKVHVRASLERRAVTPGGKKKPHWTAQQVLVTREASTAPVKK